MKSAFLLLFILAIGLQPAIAEHEHRFFYYMLGHAALFAAMLGLRKSSVRTALLLGAAARLFLIAAPPFTSWDSSRYLWDGYVASQGIDPYTHSPSSLMALDYPLPRDNREYPTLYPPLALGLFALSANYGGLFTWKILCAFFSIASLLALLPLLKAHGKTRLFPLVALHPLLILESGVGAHLDAVVGFFLVAGLCLSLLKLEARAAIALALGTLLKFVPAFAFVFLLKTRRGALYFAGVLGAAYLFCHCLGWRPLGSLFVFFQKWSFGSPLGFIPGPLRILCFATLLVLLWHARMPAIKKTQFSLIGLLLLSPVVFPWYLTSVCLLAPFAATRFTLFWSAVMPFTYEVMIRYENRGEWAPALWPLLLIAGAWVISLIPHGSLIPIRSLDSYRLSLGKSRKASL